MMKAFTEEFPPEEDWLDGQAESEETGLLEPDCVTIENMDY